MVYELLGAGDPEGAGQGERVGMLWVCEGGCLGHGCQWDITSEDGGCKCIICVVMKSEAKRS